MTSSRYLVFCYIHRRLGKMKSSNCMDDLNYLGQMSLTFITFIFGQNCPKYCGYYFQTKWSEMMLLLFSDKMVRNIVIIFEQNCSKCCCHYFSSFSERIQKCGKRNWSKEVFVFRGVIVPSYPLRQKGSLFLIKLWPIL